MIKNPASSLFAAPALPLYQWVLIPWVVSFFSAVSQRTASATALTLVGTIFLLYLTLGLRKESPSQPIVVKPGIGSVVAVVALCCLWLFVIFQYPCPQFIFLNLDDVAVSIALWIASMSSAIYRYKWNDNNPGDQKARNILIFGLLIFLGIFWIRLAYDVGFEKLYLNFDKNPERLRDITFWIWDHFKFKEHLGLSYYSIEDFKNKVAYEGHTLPYLAFMYAFNSLSKLWPNFSIRNVAVAEMSLLSFAIAFVIYSRYLSSLKSFKGMLIYFLAIGFCLTSPQYWISAGKANVDNSAFLVCGFLVLLSYIVAGPSWKQSKIPLFLILAVSLLAPLNACLLAVYWLLHYLHVGKNDSGPFFARYAGLLLLLSLSIYAYAPLAIHLGHFHTSSSTWAFRSGLDGDTYSFLNFFQAVISPSYPRPFINIVLPMLVLLLQFAVMFFYKDKRAANEGFSKSIFLGSVSTTYLGAMVFWPQAISVHPYLFDFFGLLPIYLFILLNIQSQCIRNNTWTMWIVILFVSVQSNLITIAQAGKCPNCFPDIPDRCGIALQLPQYSKAGSCQF
jgi:hypothetical protein